MENIKNRWSLPPKHLKLVSNEIHVWIISIKQNYHLLDYFENLLSSDELNRADRFIKPEHKNRFVISRGVLRNILSKYTNKSPEDLKFLYGKHGKPELAENQNSMNINFNLSHSLNLVLYCITTNIKVGVDLENIHNIKQIDVIVKRFFSRYEYQEFSSLSKDEKKKLFFEYWTCKEAYLKAAGFGLHKPLNKVTLSIGKEGKPASYRSIDNSSKKASKWSLTTFEPHKKYFAAVTAEGTDFKYSYYKWAGTKYDKCSCK